MFKKFLTCSLIATFLAEIILPAIPVQAALSYPEAGYCQDFQTRFNFDSAKVPNYALSEYLGGKSPQEANVIMKKIQLDQICIQKAKMQNDAKHTQDQIKRRSLQLQIDSLNRQELKEKEALKIQEEKLDKINKLLETLRNIDKTNQELLQKSFIDEGATALQTIHENRVRQDEEIRLNQSIRQQEIIAMLELYRKQTPSQKTAYQEKISQELQNEFRVLKTQFQNQLNEIKSEIQENLLYQLNQEEKEFIANTKQEYEDPILQENSIQAFHLYRMEKEKFYQDLITDFLNKLGFEGNQISNTIEKVIGSANESFLFFQSQKLALANLETDFSYDDYQNISNEDRSQKIQELLNDEEKYQTISETVYKLNTLMSSSKFALKSILKDSKLRQQAIIYLKKKQFKKQS